CYPAAMILPTSIFDFLQESDDFYFPPLVGTYLRLTRMLVFALALFLTPTWYLLISNPDWLPPGLKFILVGEPAAVPVLIQLLLAEFAIDGLKLASLNTPSMLNSSFSVVGALILGDFAVQTGWFSAEVILYMAVVAIANFTQQSYELGYACKFMRIISLIATGIFGIYGYAAVFIFTILLIASNKTVDGMRRYLYPLIPFNARALKHVFIKDK
ncbi:MAG: spore germination protein, partial [Firmicutes bacterium]|nr:spore germination protein [Bacillota bacterium]